ncbi:hypothetical protein UlMin_013294 [Ulmus minor]
MAEEHVSDFSIKVYVDKTKNRVVYAECGGDFVDVLLSFLTTPLGTIVSLARRQSLPTEMGCLSNLYTISFSENMDVQNFHSRASKTMLLEPRNSAETHCMNLKLEVYKTLVIKYDCSSHHCTIMEHRLVSHYSDAFCSCGNSMNRKVNLSQEPMNVGGSFVKEDIGFIITDDLQVLCVSSSVFFSSCSKLGIMDMRTLEVRSLNVGANELMISKSKKTVCYAEADKDFVNLLFSFLTVPLGHVVKQIQNGCFNGCVNHLYKSVQYLDENCFKEKGSANLVLSPSLALGCWYRNDLLGIEKSEDVPYCCSGSIIFPKIYSVSYGGFLRGNKMFIVSDKLVIAPISLELCISILEEMKVPFTDIVEKSVKVNRELALRLLMSSFVSESALTNAFIKEPINDTSGCYAIKKEPINHTV